jgi:Protein of unknown function (DUF642)/PEP-CTERM motif
MLYAIPAVILQWTEEDQAELMSSNQLYRISYIAILTAILVALPAHANNLLSNGSFENPVVDPSSQCGPYADCFGYHNSTPGNDFIGQWLLLPNAPIPSGWAAVMVTGPNYHEANNATGAPLFFHAQDGQQALDLTGEGNQGDWNGVKQTVSTTPGSKYDLSFYLGHQYSGAPGYSTGPSGLNLYVDGQWAGLFTNDHDRLNDISWQGFSYDFTASGTSTTIAFQNANAYGNNYSGLDNVSLHSVPEPGTLALLFTGIVGLIGMSRRRRS